MTEEWSILRYLSDSLSKWEAVVVDPMLDDYFQFLKHAFKTCTEPDRVFTFSCPVCGSLAYVRKSGADGRYVAFCSGCSTQFED